MAQIDAIRNGIIDKLLAISDKDYLMALMHLVDNSDLQNEKIKLTKEQKLMLEMSETDIQNGRLISQSDLDKSDLEWLKKNSLHTEPKLPTPLNLPSRGEACDPLSK
ncbi:hypothetical protein [uncultured Fluviicola sp.]|uniref:hypothetical protein n=1 Tax=uncultured Fluviicola sp. TaxID=463303 RepID=UPI0025E33DA7|nr:hypothetical protein [uncultured Fluviicola sp.]